MTATHHALASTTFFLPPSVLHLCKLARFLQFKNCGTQLVTVPRVCDRGKHLISLLGQSVSHQGRMTVQSPPKHLLCISATIAACAVSMCLLRTAQLTESQCSGFWPLIITHFQTTDLTFQDRFWWIEMSQMVGQSVVLLHCKDHSQSGYVFH